MPNPIKNALKLISQKVKQYIVNGWNRLILSPGNILRLRIVILCLIKLITRVLKPYIYPNSNHLITTCPTIFVSPSI